jgi:hypothetical protein
MGASWLYSPEIVALMTTVLDIVRQSVSYRVNDNAAVNEKLAEIILRHVDEGERDAERLAAVALREWTGSAPSSSGDRSATG